MSAESNFYALLEEIFCGKNVSGKGGYVNLLSIKHVYYENILKEFKREIDREELIIGKFKEEFFDKLYNFFEKYFSEAGSIYFAKTPKNKNVYEQVYSNSQDVTLFYKTNMLYYVKTDTIFNNADIIVNENTRVTFNVSGLELRKNNEKKKLFYSLESVIGNNLTLSVTYAQGNTKPNYSTICKEAKKQGLIISEEDLINAIKGFVRQSEVDYFINKNASKFLTEQLEFFFHDILLQEENAFNNERLKKIKLIHTYAKKLTRFVTQFEDELVRIWNKPKFVLNSGYLCSVGLISDEILSKIVGHHNYELQVNKWHEQKQMLDFNVIDISTLKANRFLFVDTRYFKEYESLIINQSDAKVKGLVINSDNYQALNTIKKKYSNNVDVIYIDPPYNTDADSFDYVDGYEGSSYLTMMYDRLTIAKSLLTDDGLIFISINDKELYELKLLCDKIFDKNNFVCNFIRKIKGGRTTAVSVDLHHDYMLCYTKNKKVFEMSNNLGAEEIERANNVQLINGIPYKKRAPLYKVDGGRKGSQYVVHNPYLGIDHYPPIFYNPSVRFGWFLGQDNYRIALEQEPNGFNDGYKWQIVFIKDLKEWEEYKAQKKKNNNSLKDEDIYSFYFLKREEESGEAKYNHLSSLFCVSETKYNNATGTSELNGMLDNVKSEGEWISDIHPKPVTLITDLITYSTRNKEKITFMDFFGGSGTSGEAAISIAHNNPDIDVDYILVEVNDYSDSILKRRIEKSHEKIGVEGVVKYYALEQYADALANVSYNKDQSYIKYSALSPYEQYIFYADEKLTKGFKMQEKLEIDLEKVYSNIDINETISNLLGLHIIRLDSDGVILDNDGDELFIKTNVINMTEDEKMEFILQIRPLIWWGE
jgi:adenine-specific DNA-methyltransferase